MPASNEKFLQIVEEAEKIAQTIAMLQEEITSYQSAGKNLEEVKNELGNYMAAARKASDNLVELTNTVSSKLIEISSKAEKLEHDLAKVTASTVEIERALENTFQTVKLNGQTLEEGLIKVHKHVRAIADEKFLEVNKKIDFLKNMIFVAIGIAVLSLILGLVF